jgi:hypothetical protein
MIIAALLLQPACLPACLHCIASDQPSHLSLACSLLKTVHSLSATHVTRVPALCARRRDEDGRARFQQDFPALSALCPPAYKSAVLACIHKDPRQRPKASLLLQQLQVGDQAGHTGDCIASSQVHAKCSCTCMSDK